MLGEERRGVGALLLHLADSHIEADEIVHGSSRLGSTRDLIGVLVPRRYGPFPAFLQLTNEPPEPTER
jgi:hypothetical protein